MRRLLSIAVALWSGSLCTICFLAAPALFATLDRHSAGQAAAALFRIQTWLGVGFALIVAYALRSQAKAPRSMWWLVGLTGGAPLASEVLLRPIMDQARAANDMARFGMIHGYSGALFLIACAGSLVLLWRVSRREE